MNSANGSTENSAASISGLFTMLEGWDETVSVVLFYTQSYIEYCDHKAARARGRVLA